MQQNNNNDNNFELYPRQSVGFHPVFDTRTNVGQTPLKIQTSSIGLTTYPSLPRRHMLNLQSSQNLSWARQYWCLAHGQLGDDITNFISIPSELMTTIPLETCTASASLTFCLISASRDLPKMMSKIPVAFFFELSLARAWPFVASPLFRRSPRLKKNKT